MIGLSCLCGKRIQIESRSNQNRRNQSEPPISARMAVPRAPIGPHS